jgi:hypothetical protein
MAGPISSNVLRSPKNEISWFGDIGTFGDISNECISAKNHENA